MNRILLTSLSDVTDSRAAALAVIDDSTSTY